ncbi:cyclic AMP-responsive element-binding protein 3-like protein 1 isoform X2 [Protopterus annectens]|uniref:cyclic AMP-responsive element-binding protein 3-like protein 1 isoform X2 n=1 Tax=Protopterus annectens TaxID=7888 RepID=UPI001CFA9013|nr:cyclic AMP-responsive element-binding protein 3-like protein 1 isoform X2 [Protopterus annectens]
MDTIMDHFATEKLFPTNSFLDLEDLTEADFLGNVHFNENLEDFSNELFNSFFDEPVWVGKSPVLDMDLDPSTPDIQAEHSYSLCGDSAPQSPLTPDQMDEKETEPETGLWTLGAELTSIMVKQEQNPVPEQPAPHAGTATAPPPAVFNFQLPTRIAPVEEKPPVEVNPIPPIKSEPEDITQFLNVPADDAVQLPPTPPSSHGSDSDGSQSPRSLPPSSPVRPQARSSTAISSSPLLTAAHKLQGTSGPLILTEEEKRTLIAEGYPIPTKLPLTKAEEKALKRVRRKIKNKISAQESRRKKKEYVDCLEKKVESYTSENNELWKKLETLENANRTLLQQLQKLQALVAGKVPRSCKMASTQTGTCLMVVVLCFVLVLGSFVPCLPEFSSLSQTVKTAPLSTPEIYTTSHIRSRSLMFYDEGAGSVEEGYGSFLQVDNPDAWEMPKDFPEEHKKGDLLRGQQTRSHETTKYLSESRRKEMDYNGTDYEFLPHRERYNDREVNPDKTTEYL